MVIFNSYVKLPEGKICILENVWRLSTGLIDDRWILCSHSSRKEDNFHVQYMIANKQPHAVLFAALEACAAQAFLGPIVAGEDWHGRLNSGNANAMMPRETNCFGRTISIWWFRGRGSEPWIFTFLIQSGAKELQIQCPKHMILIIRKNSLVSPGNSAIGNWPHRCKTDAMTMRKVACASAAQSSGRMWICSFLALSISSEAGSTHTRNIPKET